VRQTGDHRDADEQALLGLLPADGSPADSTEIRSRLGWDAERYASACVRLGSLTYRNRLSLSVSVIPHLRHWALSWALAYPIGV